MTDLELAQAALDCYGTPSSGWERVWIVDGVWMGYRAPILAFRGSKTPEDWIRDLRAYPSYNSDIGFTEGGFMDGMRAAFTEWRKGFGDVSPWITGHSLGAAHATIMAALMVAEKATLPQALVLFGTPRPGFFKLRRVVRSGKFDVRSYHNDGDPVSDLPVPVWRVLPYRHVTHLTELHAGGDPGDPSPIAAHKMVRYVAALEAKA